MNERSLYKFPDLERVAGIKNRVTLKRRIDRDGFPPGFYDGPNSRVWYADEVHEWVRQRASAEVQAVIAEKRADVAAKRMAALAPQRKDIAAKRAATVAAKRAAAS